MKAQAFSSLERTLTWQRLSARERGAKDDQGPYEDVPPHLAAALSGWINKTARDKYYEERWDASRLAAACHIGVETYGEDISISDVVGAAAMEQPDSVLDLIDAALRFESVSKSACHRLDELLQHGGSVWRVDPGNTRLVRRVDRGTAVAFEQASLPPDAASGELEAAWAAAYGRNPDASDAWDHAIKAVESALISIVVPAKAKATLGDVVGTLNAQGEHWQLALHGHDDSMSVAPLVSMLRLIWPNPDRHGNAGSRKPSLGEAQAAVSLAVTIVQWAHAGVLSKRPQTPRLSSVS